VFFVNCFATVTIDLTPAPALAGRLLFFVWMSDMDVVNVENAGAFFCQRKGVKRKPLDAACFLRSGIFVGVCQKGLPVPLAKRDFGAAPLRAVPDKTHVLGAAYGSWCIF